MPRLRVNGSAWVLLLGLGCSSGKLSVGTRDVLAAGEAGAPSEAATAPTERAASLPIGIENVNNSPLKAASYRVLLRFVPDRALRIDRLYFGFNLQGAACQAPDMAGDGSGDGGVVDASLVDIDAQGLPGVELARETVAACARYTEARDDVGSNPVLVWVNLQASLAGGKMYGLVLRNAASKPSANYFSVHLPIADATLAGPQARNELDPAAPGAIMSLDPREHVAWSDDAGATWQYGASNGQYASFINDDALHPAARVPQYGFREEDGRVSAPQPYYAYSTDCVGCSVVYANARYARRFSFLGGFNASADEVGTLTLTNLQSGLLASCTVPPGYGFRTCDIEPVDVAVGESYSISSTGSVELMRMDNAQRVMFPAVGTSDGELRAFQPEPAPDTNEKDVPSLWAGPLSANFPTNR